MRDLIIRWTTGSFNGATATGKTSLLVGLAVHRAQGLPAYLGRAVREGETVFLSTEDGIDAYRRALFAWCDFLKGIDFEKVANRIHLIDLRGEAFPFVRGHLSQCEITENVDAVAAVIRERAPRADHIINETVGRLALGDESNAAMTAIINAGERLACRTGAAVSFVHHVGKGNAREGVDDEYAGRGGSAFADNGRATIVLKDPSAKEIENLIGIEPSPDELSRLLLLVPAKINGIPRSRLRPILIERVETSAALVLREYSPVSVGQDPAQVRALVAQRAEEDGLDRLRTLVAGLTQPGGVEAGGVSAKRLATIYRDRLDLAKHRTEALVARALEAGVLVKAGKGRGGADLLVPGNRPGEPSQNRPEAASQSSRDVIGSPGTVSTVPGDPPIGGTPNSGTLPRPSESVPTHRPDLLQRAGALPPDGGTP